MLCKIKIKQYKQCVFHIIVVESYFSPKTLQETGVHSLVLIYPSVPETDEYSLTYLYSSV
jgi:hypothetical protein